MSESFLPTRVNPSTVYVHILNILPYDTEQYMSLSCNFFIVMNIVTEQTTPAKIKKDIFY
jgi:hypothetical protein